MIFEPISEASIATLPYKNKVLRWYENNHNDLIRMKYMKSIECVEIAGSYQPIDKYTYKQVVKDAIKNTISDKPIGYLGYFNNDKLYFVLEIYQNGIRTVMGVPTPRLEYHFIPIHSLAKKHEGYYINKIKFDLDRDCNNKANRFIREQKQKMDNDK